MVSSEEARRVTDWRRERGKTGDSRAEGWSAVGDGGKLQCHSYLPLMAVGPCWNLMHILIFESLQLEDSYIGDFLYVDSLSNWTCYLGSHFKMVIC